MQAVLAFFTSLFTAFTALFSCAGSTQVNPLPTNDNFVPAVRFMVFSDTHIDDANDLKLDRISKAVNYGYKFGEGKEYTALDAVMFTGDVTNGGLPEQFNAFEKTIKESVKEETDILAVVAKNHDGYEGKGALDYCRKITDDEPDFHKVINGFHFIGISTSKLESERYGLYQRTWLRKQLNEAVKDSPDKPVFVFSHEHVRNTVYGSSSFEGWGITYFKDILEQYPQVVHFSGHSHYPLNDPRSVNQNRITTVGTGAMAYMEFAVDKDRSIHPSGNENAAQCWIVEADSEGNLMLHGTDVLHEEELCTYYINNPALDTAFAYNTESIKARSSAPKFPEGAELGITADGSKYTVTVPAAESTDGKIIFVYRISVTNKSGKELYSTYFINNYWQNDTYKEISFDFEAEKGCKVSCTAENAYGMQSSPLTAEL